MKTLSDPSTAQGEQSSTWIQVLFRAWWEFAEPWNGVFTQFCRSKWHVWPSHPYTSPVRDCLCRVVIATRVLDLEVQEENRREAFGKVA